MRILREETHQFKFIGNTPVEHVIVLQIPVPESEADVESVPEVLHFQLGAILN